MEYESQKPVELSVAAPSAGMRAEASRFAMFLAVGGVCALVNLAIVSVLTLGAKWAYLPAALIATETSIFLGFLLNDRFTFRRLAGQAGGWWARCLRFHGGYAAGQVLTIGMSLALIATLRLLPVVAQAISLIVATLFNFAVQRLLTYAARR